MNINKSKIKYIISMLIFGSIGLFANMISIPSTQVVLGRTIIGSIFLIILLFVRGKTIDIKAILQNFWILFLIGIALATSWITLFEAFKYTSVGIAIVLYYLAPIIVFILSPILFKEKLTITKIIGIISAIIGMLIINLTPTIGTNPKKGIICAIISALFYALLVILNKNLKNIGGIETTVAQLVIAAIIIFFYLLFSNGFATPPPTTKDILLIIFVGILHTGVACYLFISNLNNLTAQNASLLSYIDPLSAIIYASIFLKEKLSFFQIIGIFLILSGTLFGQLKFKKTE